MKKIKYYDYVYWIGIIAGGAIGFFRYYNLMAFTIVFTLSASGFLLINAENIKTKVKMRLLFTFVSIVIIVLILAINM